MAAIGQTLPQPLSNIRQPQRLAFDSANESDVVPHDVVPHDVNRDDLAEMFQKTSQDLTGGRAMQEGRTISDLSALHGVSKGPQVTDTFYSHKAGSLGDQLPPPPRPPPMPGYPPPMPGYPPPMPGYPPPMPGFPQPIPGYYPPIPGYPPPNPYHTVPMDMVTGSYLPLDWAPKWPALLGNHRKAQSPTATSFNTDRDDVGDMDNTSSMDASADPDEARSQITVTSNDHGASKQASAHSPGADAPDLASVLSRTATEHLGLDLLGDDPQSQFVAHLLNDIALLQAQLRVLDFRLHKAHLPPATNPVIKPIEIPAEIPPEVLKQRMQVLHRVYEGSMNVKIYADQPEHVEVVYMNWVLRGKKPILDLESYLRSHPDIYFVVFREYENEKPRTGSEEWGPSRRPNPGHEYMDGPSSRKERMRIVEETLQQAVRSIGTCGLNDTSAHEIEAPYLYFYQHRDEWEKVKEDENKDVREPAQQLWSYLDEHYATEYREADELIGRGFITPRHLAKLYKPNDIVINFKDHKPEAWMINTWPKESDENKINFEAWNWKFSGITFSRNVLAVSEKIPARIAQVQSEMRINDLEYIPRRFVSDSTRTGLLARGRKYWDMRKRTFASYSGSDAWCEDSYDNARIMIDTETYHRMVGSNSRPAIPYMQSPRAVVSTLPTSIHVDDKMPEQGLVLLPMTVNGYDFQNKRWIKLFVDQIGPPEWNKRAFERLVLDKKSKDMIKALISVHVQADRKKMHDIIRNKGNGLIILLHGSPGTGKTLTAESVAELAEKPLYSVSCGDIGTDAEEVEKHLRTVLYLGKIWDCVLLLDEADVFLEERAMADLHRNSLVSVFLRCLEYYDGILILTSNRVGTFDEAFRSRIQVALHYKPLTKASRKKIWRNFFEILEESGDVNMSELEDRLEELASEEMNGRQIRNALHTARQIAVYRKETLDWEHLRQVIATATDFSRYLKKVHGLGDEESAREDGRR